MSIKGYILVAGIFVLFGAASVVAQESNVDARLMVEASPAETPAEPKVTMVYGISADDYLPSAESLKKQVRAKKRSAASHPSFVLPEAFYFIGGPIFLIIFLRVLVIFLNEFEEKRREEQRKARLEMPEAE